MLIVTVRYPVVVATRPGHYGMSVYKQEEDDGDVTDSQREFRTVRVF